MFQKQFNEIDEEYEETMLEKYEYNQMKLKQKLYTFLLKRAIKKIQRAWRRYYFNKMAKKGAKMKGKGKNKARANRKAQG